MFRLSVANQQSVLVPDRRRLRSILKNVLKEEDCVSADVSLALVDDATIAAINQRFLRHEGPTDVITFPYSQSGAALLEGEIVLSTETAEREAEQRGHAPAAEVYLYFIHGLLHLCGYDDHEPGERRRMRRRERHHLAALNIQLKT